VSESDGIDEVVAGAVRVAVQAAAWRVEASARRRQQEALTAVRGSTDQYTRWVAQQQAGRDAAGTELRHTVDEPGWWDTATPDGVGRAWETAQTWRDSSPDVDRQARVVEREAAGRWGVDPVRASAGLDAADTREQPVRDAVAEGRDVPRAGEPWQEAQKQAKVADRVDLATAGPGVARPGERAHIPSIAELIRSRPDAQRTAAAGRGVRSAGRRGDRGRGAHQVRPAKAAVATLTKAGTRQAVKPRTAVRATQRDAGRDGR
jgi:hypothetical protein